jgi:solute carrier family 25 phosphate transporter 23/24/25/41
MWREEGFKGFMRGNGVNCVRIVPYSAVQFTSYEQLKKVHLSILPPAAVSTLVGL